MILRGGAVSGLRVAPETSTNRLQFPLLKCLGEQPFVDQLQPLPINHYVVVVATVMFVRASVDLEQTA